MVEFTGERVIPGQVNDDLWSEHVARYAFASRFAEGKRVLDAGCGAGYGAAELAQSALQVTGLDIAPDAVEYARATYPIPNLFFLVSSCIATPFRPNSFELVVAFEVIEHLQDYRAFLNECARVVTPQGLFIVSSPNKSYYAESRAKTGPNPFHEHEFEADEFVSELSRVFSNVRLLLENRVESFAFHPARTFWPAGVRIDGGGGTAAEANFLIGLCSFGRLPDPQSFVYVPKAANLLREREQHVQLLEQQLARTKRWLAEAQAERDTLLDLYRKQTDELVDRTRWAEKLGAELDALGVVLTNERKAADSLAREYEARVTHLEGENLAKTEWALATVTSLEQKASELAECVRLLEAAETTVEERTLWAQRTEKLRADLAAQLDLIRQSRWLKLGRKFGLGPDL
ncbi:MAG: methyltransferase domain-containing protein [Bryobacteraceae bacterium]